MARTIKTRALTTLPPWDVRRDCIKMIPGAVETCRSVRHVYTHKESLYHLFGRHQRVASFERARTLLQVFRAKYFPAPEPVQVDLDEPKQAQVLCVDHPPAPEQLQVDLSEPEQVQELRVHHPPTPEVVQIDLCESTQVQELVAVQPPEPEIVQVDLKEPMQVQVLPKDHLPEPELVQIDLREPKQVEVCPEPELAQMDQSEPTEVDRPVVSKKQMRKTKRISKSCVISFPGEKPEFTVSFGEVDRSLFKLSSQKSEEDEADKTIETQTPEPEQDEENQKPEYPEIVEAYTTIAMQTPEPEQEEENQKPENPEIVEAYTTIAMQTPEPEQEEENQKPETFDKELLLKSVTSEQKDTNPLTPESSENPPSATQLPEPEEEPQAGTTLEKTDDEVLSKTLQVASEPTEHIESNPLTMNDSNFPQLTRGTLESRRNVSWQPKRRRNWKASNPDNQTPTEDERLAQSTPREPKVPQETSHQNLIEVSGPSIPSNSETIAEKHDECLSMEIPIKQQEINICTRQEEEPNKVENNTELPREPSVRPKYWGRNRYHYNREFRQNNFSSEYSRGSQVPEYDQSRYQKRSSFQTVAPIEEHEEEQIIPNSRNRYRYNNEFRRNNYSREYGRGSQVPEFDRSHYQERSSFQTVAPIEEQEDEPIISKRKNGNRRSKQTLRLQRLLIQPQLNDEREWTEDDDDDDGEILMSQLTDSASVERWMRVDGRR
ncbi:hypothetical protein WMY93_020016 [Mugilogobius chulae]|uniref:Uncharacterized protein n=1 Tax=Mugilogobius chulae TaxID=88201 RepID=A0AAW0NIT3_9GOBI